MRNLLKMLLALLLASVAVPAAAAGLQDVIAAVEQGYGSIEDMQAKFSQRTYIGSLKREEKGGGEFLLKKRSSGSAMFRFNYTKPQQQIISNGRTVWYYLPENKQVIVTDAAKLFAGGNAIAMSYLTGLGNLAADFTIKLAGDGVDKSGNYLLELVPRKNNQAVAKLLLTVAAEAVEKHAAGKAAAAGFPIVASVLHDQLGNRTTIEYSDIKVNRGLGSDRFSFKVPAGVEVIKQ